MNFRTSKELAEFIIKGFYDGDILKAEDASKFIDAYVEGCIQGYDMRMKMVQHLNTKFEKSKNSVKQPLSTTIQGKQTTVTDVKVSPRSM